MKQKQCRILLKVNFVFLMAFTLFFVAVSVAWMNFTPQNTPVSSQAENTGDEQKDSLIATIDALAATIEELVNEMSMLTLLMTGCAMLGFILNIVIIALAKRSGSKDGEDGPSGEGQARVALI